jgi:hypothetical protein
MYSSDCYNAACRVSGGLVRQSGPAQTLPSRQSPAGLTKCTRLHVLSPRQPKFITVDKHPPTDRVALLENGPYNSSNHSARRSSVANSRIAP